MFDPHCPALGTKEGPHRKLLVSRITLLGLKYLVIIYYELTNLPIHRPRTRSLPSPVFTLKLWEMRIHTCYR